MPTDERKPLLSQTASYKSTAASPAPQKTEPSPSDLKWILIAIWSALFLVALDSTVVATLLTSVGSHFNKVHHASYLGTSYLLSVCCFTPLYGRSSDIIGRKGAMLVGLSLFALGTVLCALAPSMNALIVARAVAGMGGGGVQTVTSIVLTDLVPLRTRGLYQGYTNIIYALGAGLGGPLGGFISDCFGWRCAFLCQVPILAIAIILVTAKLDIKLSTKNQSLTQKLKRLDIFGSLTLVLAVSSLLLAVTLNASEEMPWSHPYVWSLMLGFITFATAFIAVEAFVALEPVMPLTLLWKRTPMAVAMANFLIGVVSFSMLYNVPVYFSAVLLMRSTEAGLLLLPNSVAIGFGSVAAGVIMRKTGKVYNICLVSASLMLFSSLLVSQWSNASAPLHFWLDMIPNGLGFSSLLTTTLVALMASVRREDIAVATGITYLFRTTGQVLSVSLTGALLQAILLKSLQERIVGPESSQIIQLIRHSTTIIPSLDPPTRQAAIESYAAALRAVFMVQSALALLTVLACLPIEENPLTVSHEERTENDEQRNVISSSGGSV